jgi:O-antigen ligase
MAFLLTLLYVVVTYLTPAELLPWLAPYGIQIWIAMLALFCSIPTVLEDSEWRVPQLGLFGVLLICILLSQLAGPNHWVGGAAQAVRDFLPNGIILPLVVLNCRSIRKLKILTTTLLFIAAYFVMRGAHAYYAGDIASPFLYSQLVSDEGPLLLRIRALSVLNDPNDFAQFIICLLPFVWLSWREGKRANELLLCGIPTAFFVGGLYLTHSRGAIIAAAVMLLFVFRRKLGTIASTILAAVAVAGLVAANVSGGRSVSLEGGADRLMLWGTGLALFKSSPLFGIGYNEFADVVGLTAHNSFVLCIAELGLLGYFVWIAIITFTFAQLNAIRLADAPGQGTELTDAILTSRVRVTERHKSIIRFAMAAKFSMIAFLTAGLFLSRAYTATFWLVLGIGMAVVQIAKAEHAFVRPPGTRRMLKWSAATVFVSITAVYAMLWARVL